MNLSVTFAPVAAWAQPHQPFVGDVARIQQRVARFYGLALIDMRSARKARDVAWPRQLAMYLVRRHTDKSLPSIGRFFGDRDHSTVIHALRAVEGRRIDIPEYDAVVRLLDREITEMLA